MDKWPACARLSAVAPTGHLPIAPTVTLLSQTQPLQGHNWARNEGRGSKRFDNPEPLPRSIPVTQCILLWVVPWVIRAHQPRTNRRPTLLVARGVFRRSLRTAFWGRSHSLDMSWHLTRPLSAGSPIANWYVLAQAGVIATPPSESTRPGIVDRNGSVANGRPAAMG
jgi:hypothetical protein